MQRNVTIIADKRAKQRAQGDAVGPIMEDPRSVDFLLTDGPKEWFELFIEGERGYRHFKPKYDALDEVKKTQFREIFDNQDVMTTKQAFTSWLGEKASDTSALTSCQTALITFISENTQ